MFTGHETMRREGPLISRMRPHRRSRLQSTSVAIGESFPIPEIVAIGGQSDGKSSLLEAFLGVRGGAHMGGTV